MTKLIVNNLCKKYDQNIVVNNFNSNNLQSCGNKI